MHLWLRIPWLNWCTSVALVLTSVSLVVLNNYFWTSVSLVLLYNYFWTSVSLVLFNNYFWTSISLVILNNNYFWTTVALVLVIYDNYVWTSVSLVLALYNHYWWTSIAHVLVLYNNYFWTSIPLVLHVILNNHHLLTSVTLVPINNKYLLNYCLFLTHFLPIGRAASASHKEKDANYNAATNDNSQYGANHATSTGAASVVNPNGVFGMLVITILSIVKVISITVVVSL